MGAPLWSGCSEEGVVMTWTIVFTNTTWSLGCKLQVRTGSASDCNNNAQVYDGTVAINVSQTIQTEANVCCWRRSADPTNPGDSNWTVWNVLDLIDPSQNPVQVDLGES